MPDYPTYGPEISHHAYVYGIDYHLITQRVPYTPDFTTGTVQGEMVTYWKTAGDGPMFDVSITCERV